MNKYAPIEQIIAKLDNDFNLDNSDWIPRVATWAIEVMSQLKVLKTVKKRRRLTVTNRIAKSKCNIEVSGLKVYDKNGCEIKELDYNYGCRCDSGISEDSSSTGGRNDEPVGVGGFGGIGVAEKYEEGKTPYDSVSVHVNKYPPNDSRVVDTFIAAPRKGCEHNYVIVDCHTIELNFDTDCIIIESNEVATMYSDYFKAEVPVIPNNGYLIEAIGYYCLYKMLCRGMKHPVFNLSASQYGTNPYYLYTTMFEKARRSVINDEIDTDNLSGAWNSYFYNYTFPKK